MNQIKKKKIEFLNTNYVTFILKPNVIDHNRMLKIFSYFV